MGTDPGLPETEAEFKEFGRRRFVSGLDDLEGQAVFVISGSAVGAGGAGGGDPTTLRSGPVELYASGVGRPTMGSGSLDLDKWPQHVLVVSGSVVGAGVGGGDPTTLRSGPVEIFGSGVGRVGVGPPALDGNPLHVLVMSGSVVGGAASVTNVSVDSGATQIYGSGVGLVGVGAPALDGNPLHVLVMSGSVTGAGGGGDPTTLRSGLISNLLSGRIEAIISGQEVSVASGLRVIADEVRQISGQPIAFQGAQRDDVLNAQRTYFETAMPVLFRGSGTGGTWDRARTMQGVSGLNTLSGAVLGVQAVGLVSGYSVVDARLQSGYDAVRIQVGAAGQDDLSNSNVRFLVDRDDTSRAPPMAPMAYDGDTWDRVRNLQAFGVESGMPLAVGLASGFSEVLTGSGSVTDVADRLDRLIGQAALRATDPAIDAFANASVRFVRNQDDSNIVALVGPMAYDGDTWDRVRNLQAFGVESGMPLAVGFASGYGDVLRAAGAVSGLVELAASGMGQLTAKSGALDLNTVPIHVLVVSGSVMEVSGVSRLIGNDDVVDAGNSSTATLGAGAAFTGTARDVLGFSTVTVLAESDVGSAEDGMTFQFSSNGSDWDEVLSFNLAAGDTRRFQLPVTARWFRVVYTNGDAAQGEFRLQSILHRQNIIPSIHRISEDTSVDRSATLVQAQILAVPAGTSGILRGVTATNQGNLKVSVEEVDATASIAARISGELVRVSGEAIRLAASGMGALTAKSGALDPDTNPLHVLVVSGSIAGTGGGGDPTTVRSGTTALFGSGVGLVGVGAPALDGNPLHVLVMSGSVLGTATAGDPTSVRSGTIALFGSGVGLVGVGAPALDGNPLHVLVMSGSVTGAGGGGDPTTIRSGLISQLLSGSVQAIISGQPVRVIDGAGDELQVITDAASEATPTGLAFMGRDSGSVARWVRTDSSGFLEVTRLDAQSGAAMLFASGRGMITAGGALDGGTNPLHVYVVSGSVAGGGGGGDPTTIRSGLVSQVLSGRVQVLDSSGLVFTTTSGAGVLSGVFRRAVDVQTQIVSGATVATIIKASEIQVPVDLQGVASGVELAVLPGTHIPMSGLDNLLPASGSENVYKLASGADGPMRLDPQGIPIMRVDRVHVSGGYARMIETEVTAPGDTVITTPGSGRMLRVKILADSFHGFSGEMHVGYRFTSGLVYDHHLTSVVRNWGINLLGGQFQGGEGEALRVNMRTSGTSLGSGQAVKSMVTVQEVGSGDMY